MRGVIWGDHDQGEYLDIPSERSKWKHSLLYAIIGELGEWQPQHRAVHWAYLANKDVPYEFLYRSDSARPFVRASLYSTHADGHADRLRDVQNASIAICLIQRYSSQKLPSFYRTSFWLSSEFFCTKARSRINLIHGLKLKAACRSVHLIAHSIWRRQVQTENLSSRCHQSISYFPSKFIWPDPISGRKLFRKRLDLSLIG